MNLNDKIKNSNPFKVPDGYFDTLTERTMSAIRESREQEETPESTLVPVRSLNYKPFLALAAFVIGFAMLATVMIKLLNTDKVSEDFETVNTLYADLAAEELDTYMIEYELSQTEPVEPALTYEEEISSEAIIDYLMMEEIDLNDIYELI